MSNYTLDFKSLERLKALMRAGKYTDAPWNFTAADSNALLGDPPEWVEYRNWFLGYDPTASQVRKEQCAYPYGKGDLVNLNALRQIVRDAGKNGDQTIADKCTEMLAYAKGQQKDRVIAAAGRGRSKVRAGILHRSVTLYAPVVKAGKATKRNLLKFDIEAYGGGPLKLDNWPLPLVLDMAGMDRIDKARPVLKDHDQTKMLGHTTAFQLSRSSIKAQGVVSGKGKHVEEVVHAADNEFPWQASVGADVREHEFVPEGQSAEANDQQWEGPIYIARRWSLGEISFVALGADDSTSARIAAKRAAGRIVMTKFEAWSKNAGFTPDTLKDANSMKTAKAAFSAAYPGSNPDDEFEETPSTSAGDDPDDVEASAGDDPDDVEASAGDDDEDDAPPPAKKGKEKVKASRQRITASRAPSRVSRSTANLLVAQNRLLARNLERVEKIRTVAAAHSNIMTQAISENWSVDKTELAVVRASRPVPSDGFSINTGAKLDLGSQMGAVAAAACLSVGIGEKSAMKGLSDNAKELATSKQLRGIGLHEIMGFVAAANGLNLHFGRINDDAIGSVLQASRRLNVQADGGGGFSTVSLGVITDNIIDRAVLEGYGMIDSVVDQIAFQTDTKTFRPFKRYRMTAAGRMQQVGQDGEVKSMGVTDESYQGQVETWAATVMLTRQMMIDDDLGALTQLPTLLGRESAQTREEQVFGVILSLKSTIAQGNDTGKPALGFNMVSSGANNYMTGANTTLGITGLTTAVAMFRQQRDKNNRPAMIVPKLLLVPTALEVAALNLFNSAELIVSALGSTSAAATTPKNNPFRSKFTPVVSPYMDAFAGGSATAWALLPAPAGGFSPVMIGYLSGQRTPVVSQGQPDFNKLGIATRIVYDFGVGDADYRSIVWSDGNG